MSLANSEAPAPNTPEHFNPEVYLKKARQIIAREHDFTSDSEPANYDAIFSIDNPPLFLNIWNHQPGSGLGYLVFHDFLLNVGQENTFNSTKFTPEGEKLFQKAVDDKLIEPVADATGIIQASQWRVIGSPIANLERLSQELMERLGNSSK